MEENPLPLITVKYSEENYLLRKPCRAALSRFGRVRLSVTPGTVTRQAPLSMGLSRQERWSGWPSPTAGIFPTQGSNLYLLRLLLWFILSYSKLNSPNQAALHSLVLCSHQLNCHSGFHSRRGKEKFWDSSRWSLWGMDHRQDAYRKYLERSQ